MTRSLSASISIFFIKGTPCAALSLKVTFSFSELKAETLQTRTSKQET